MDKKTISTMKKCLMILCIQQRMEQLNFGMQESLWDVWGIQHGEDLKDAINRAIESCKSAEIEVSDHFADAVKMVEIGSKAVRDVDDILLTRSYCAKWRTKKRGNCFCTKLFCCTVE